MFNDTTIKLMNFDCSVKDKRLFDEGSCQTKNIENKNVEIQTHAVTSIGIQVTYEDIPNKLNFSFEKSAENLGLFFDKVLPCLYDELQSCSDFDYLKYHNKISWNTKKNEKIEMNDSSQLKEIIKKTDYKDALVSHLTWNSNGMLLGMAFSKKEHESWCNHEMSISLYNICENHLGKKSSQSIKLNSCIKKIQFHPFVPSILAGGFHNGDVLIWDIKNVDLILFLKLKENGIEECHNESVTFVGWKDYESDLNLVTGGKDGKIIFWKVLLSSLTYQVDKRFVLLHNNETEISRKGEYFENVCIGFWSDKECDFIATADEKVFHCSLRKKDKSSVLEYKNPIQFNYVCHKGIVTNVACLSQSKFFATCATDGEVRIYASENKIPIYLFCLKNSATDIKWAGAGSHLISWGKSGIIEYHEFNYSEKTYFSTTLYNVGKNISTLAFNPKRKEIIAFGCENGEIVILNTFNTQ